MNRATESKYYETVLYHLVYSELVSAARHQGLTTYQYIAEIMGLKPSGNLMGRETGEIIGAISANEVFHNRPMLSAVVVNTQGVPGGGLYDWAEKLGVYDPDAFGDEKEFWHEELKRVYETWRREYRA